MQIRQQPSNRFQARGYRNPMAKTQIAVFSTKPYDEAYLSEANQAHGHELTFVEARLTEGTARLAEGKPVVSIFVNDDASADVLAELVSGGTRLLALRSAGFNHVDLDAAAALGLEVVRVPEYSPHAVAEFTVGMILTLGRKYHRAQNRVREGNFSLEGLMGFDLHTQTVGIIGTGKIGHVLAKILRGFGCDVVAHDPYPNEETAPSASPTPTSMRCWPAQTSSRCNAPSPPIPTTSSTRRRSRWSSPEWC